MQRSPERFQIAERTFATVEGLGQAAISTIVEEASKFGKSKQARSRSRLAYKKTRQNLALFLATQYFRTPDQKESMLKMHKVMTKIELNLMAANAGIVGDELHNFDIEFSDEVETGLHIKGTFECALQAMLPLANFIWLFYYNDSKRDFITSDAPVILYPHIKHPMMGEGLLSPGMEIIYTLSPRLVVCLAERKYHKSMEKFDGHCIRIVSDDFAENLNQIYLQTSRNFLYGSSDDFTWATNLLDKYPQWREPFKRAATASGPFSEGVDDLFAENKEPSEYVLYWGRETSESCDRETNQS